MKQGAYSSALRRHANTNGAKQEADYDKNKKEKSGDANRH